MSNGSQQVGASLLAIEANVIIAGFEGIAISWILYAVSMSYDIFPPDNLASNFSTIAYTIYSIYGLLAVIIIGFIVEGLSGLLETLVSRRWWCGKRGESWDWYSELIDNEILTHTQNRIWNSSHAHQDFSRRRLRILVTRNTLTCGVILTIGLILTYSIKCYFYSSLIAFIIGSMISCLFFYLWIDARKGYKNDVEIIRGNNQ